MKCFGPGCLTERAHITADVKLLTTKSRDMLNLKSHAEIPDEITIDIDVANPLSMLSAYL